jgi:hypothetical protein
MYCERCGKQIDEGLNYCSACGTQLRREPLPPQRFLTAFLMASLASTTIIGLIVLALLIVTLLAKGSQPEPVFAFAVVYLITLFGICFMIMRQVSKLIDVELRSRELPARAAPLVQLPPRSTSQLEEFREPASVTDHTTRTLEPNSLHER